MMMALLSTSVVLGGCGGSSSSSTPAASLPILSVAAATVAEGSSGGSTGLDFTVTLSAASSSDVMVNYVTSDGTALSSSDYTVADASLTITAGDTTGTITVAVNADTTFEADETFGITLSNPTGATLGPASATGTIINDDSLPTLSVAATSVAEGSGGGSTSLDFIVILNTASSSYVIVDYATSDGTAVSSSDYTATSGTLIIAAGDTTSTITVIINADTTSEADETFGITLSNPRGATLGAASTTGTISNDDLPTLSVAAASVAEGSGGGATNLDFTVTLSAVSSSDVMVDYVTSDGTALSSSDYTIADASLTITAGDATATITVIVNADTTFEADEILGITLSNPTGAILGVASATGIIFNDDPGGLNDTGITLWGDKTANNLGVTQASFPGQDADYGRDGNAATNSDTDGRAGFSFTKLDGTGTALLDQAAAYAITPWSCVQDNVTGLMWEVKTPTNSSYQYSWYNSTGVNDGGNAGTANAGGPPGGTPLCGNKTDCDTEKYVAAVNAAGLCGYTDWRLPTAKNLRSIVDFGIAPSGLILPIDSNYFPHTFPGYHWSSSPSAGNASAAWYINFGAGESATSGKSGTYSIRLVRGGF